MAVWDTSVSTHVEIGDDYQKVTYYQGTTKGVAFGSPVMKGEEEHAYTVTINKSKYNDGGGILIGLIDADPVAQGTTRRAFGLYPIDGKMYQVEGAGGKSKPIFDLVRGGLSGKAAGATIRMEVNMKLRKAYCSVNGSPPMDIGIKLPKSVLPWMQFTWGEAQLTLSDYQGPEERGELKDRLERTSALAKEAKQRAEEAERKVAETLKWKKDMEEMLARQPDQDSELVRSLRARISELETALSQTKEELDAKEEAVVKAEETTAAVSSTSADVARLSKENEEMKEDIAILKEEVEMWKNRAWAAEEKVKSLEAKTRELSAKETEVVATVDAGQSASQSITESPASPAIAPLMMFGVRAEQGSGDYKVTAVGTVEVKMLMDAWQGGENGIVNRFVITRIEGIKVLDELEQKFQNKCRAVDSQMASMKATKQDTFTDSDGDKKKIIEKLRKKYTRTDGLGHAKLLVCFHGCDERAANKICSEGFGMTKKDSRYGAGCKVSTCAAQVCRALASTEGITKTSDGEFVLLVAWAVPGPVYPISRKDDYKPGEEFSRFANNRLKPPFMAHYACIGADGESLAGTALEGPTDDVMIIQTAEQILPAYRIYFKEA